MIQAMIGRIKGTVEAISIGQVIVDVQGVGYIVHTLPFFAESLSLETPVKFWTYTAIRENDISIYGFETETELVMFEKLLSVSGIGPKSALSILGVAGLKTLEEAIISGNTAILTKIAGVGKKTADKIVLELAGKVASSEMSPSAQEDLDVLEALKSLGYKDHQVKDILKELPDGLSNVNEKIKEALKILGKK